VLLESSLGHEAVIGWLSVLVDTSVAEGLLGTTVARARVTSSNPIAVQARARHACVRTAHASPMHPPLHRLCTASAQPLHSLCTAVQMSLQNKLTELRSTYASMPDELSGR
jgi:hypothetical protein